MVWSNVHPDADTDADGRPLHPDTGDVVCGYSKTDATDKNGRKRTDIPYCLLPAGWGGPRSEGHCRKHGGGGPGGPEGWANGNARHLLYSNRMSPEDREVFDVVVNGPDGDLIDVDDMADMLKTSIGFEYTRLVRAVDHIPDTRLVENWRCPECGDVKQEESGECSNVVYRDPDVGEITCGFDGDYVVNNRFVEFGDDAVQRKESHLANLIRVYKQVSDGADVNLKGDVTHRGDPEAPVEVEISHVRVDLPEDEQVTTTDPDE